jgi:LysR family nitrogen assimilation transcriptional regulator
LNEIITSRLADTFDLPALTYFVGVAEAGAFSKASAILNIPQPTLSRHIGRLEEQLGARLFDRNGRGVLLTEAGNSLYQHGKVIIARMQQARAEIADIGSNPTGNVVLGLAPIAGKILSAPVAERFLKELPRSNLRIVEGFTGYVLEWVVSGRVDVGILYEDGVCSSLEGEPLWREELFLVSPKGCGLEGVSEIAVADIAQFPIIISSRPHGLRLKVDELAAKAKVDLNIVIEVDALTSILDLVHKGVGRSILTPPALYGFERASEIVLTKLVRPAVSSSVIAVTSKQRPVTKAVRVLMEIIRDEAKQIRKTGRASVGGLERSRAAVPQPLALA